MSSAVGDSDLGRRATTRGIVMRGRSGAHGLHRLVSFCRKENTYRSHTGAKSYDDHMVNETGDADTDDEARARFVVPPLSARGRRSWDSREVHARRQGIAAHLEDSMAQHLAAARTYGHTLARHGQELDEAQWRALANDLEASLSAAMAETRLITNLLRGHGRPAGSERKAHE